MTDNSEGHDGDHEKYAAALHGALAGMFPTVVGLLQVLARPMDDPRRAEDFSYLVTRLRIESGSDPDLAIMAMATFMPGFIQAVFDAAGLEVNVQEMLARVAQANAADGYEDFS